MARRTTHTAWVVGLWLILTLTTGVALGLTVSLSAWWPHADQIPAATRIALQFAIAGGVWLLVAGASWLVARQLDRILARDWLDIVAWIHRLDDQHWQPLPIADSGPWGQLSYALNHMAQRLASAQAQRDLFLASVAHELKTPLTVLRANLEGLAGGELPATPARWAALHREIQRLTRLVNDLLLIETWRTPTPPLQRTVYALHEQVQETLLKFRPLAAVREITLESTCEAAMIEADRDRMDQVLTNLLDNALRHTPAGGHITMTVHSQVGHVVWCIDDSGPGIPDRQQADVLQPFYRDPRSPGSGLGLAVALTIVQAHGGTLQIQHSSLGGARVCVALPRAEAPS